MTVFANSATHLMLLNLLLMSRIHRVFHNFHYPLSKQKILAESECKQVEYNFI